MNVRERRELDRLVHSELVKTYRSVRYVATLLENGLLPDMQVRRLREALERYEHDRTRDGRLRAACAAHGVPKGVVDDWCERVLGPGGLVLEGAPESVRVRARQWEREWEELHGKKWAPAPAGGNGGDTRGDREERDDDHRTP